MSGDPLAVAIEVAKAIDECGLRYLVGGSLASSMGGEPRSTLDVDIVISMQETDVACLLRALGPDFYVDETAVRRAVQRRSTVNLIHQPTAIKVDLFMAGGTPIDDQQLDRRRRVQVGSAPDRYLYFHTPEDILLQKLRWYRLGGEQSDRQWRDILGIVTVQAGRIDTGYLRRQAETLAVADLLDRAFKATGEQPGRSSDDIPWTSVTSSVMTRVRYDADAATLDVVFQSGNVYRYFDIPATVYQELLSAESKGQFFNAHIRDRFTSATIDA